MEELDALLPSLLLYSANLKYFPLQGSSTPVVSPTC